MTWPVTLPIFVSRELENSRDPVRSRLCFCRAFGDSDNWQRWDNLLISSFEEQPTSRARANVTFADQELADDDIHVLEPSSCTAVEPEPALDTEVTQDRVETDTITEVPQSFVR